MKCLGSEEYHSYHSKEDKRFDLDGEQWERKYIGSRSIFFDVC